MQKSSKFLIGTGILVAIVLAGVLVGWLGGRVSTSSGNNLPVANSAANSNILASTTPHVPTPEPPPVVNVPQPAVTPAAPAAAATNVTADWEDKIDTILGNDDDDTNKVKELFALFPTLPEDGQDEAAQHLSNLVSDEDYAPLGELLKNPKLPEAVLDTLMADVLNRPNAIKLPMFLDLARNPDHPKAEESKDMLELYLDENYGNDWNKWQEKMVEWLKENPD